ncbi:MAG: hypothetical protein HC895_19965 [Leptolyngbyaceae cyanobacterium SM1_3_5]|nr:hypothetical protein [Leptolyngbyaceae cyanobacterium SM1_3_5]
MVNEDYQAPAEAASLGDIDFGSYDNGNDRTLASSNGFAADFDENEFITSEEPPIEGASTAGSNIDFLDEFDEFDDLGSLPDFDMSENSAGFTSPSIGSPYASGSIPASMTSDFGFTVGDGNDASIVREEEIFSISGTSDSLPTFAQSDSRSFEPDVNVEQGSLAFLENAPLRPKKLVGRGNYRSCRRRVLANGPGLEENEAGRIRCSASFNNSRSC